MKSSSDSCARTALRLCESLVYLLVEQGLVSKQQVIDAFEDVVEIEQGAAEADRLGDANRSSVALLNDILTSINAMSNS